MKEPYAGYTPILPDSDEEVALENRVFTMVYTGENNLYDRGEHEVIAIIQELWREFVFRESWYCEDQYKPKEWYMGYVDALNHLSGECPPGGFKGPNGNPRTDYDFGWNAGWKASS